MRTATRCPAPSRYTYWKERATPLTGSKPPWRLSRRALCVRWNRPCSTARRSSSCASKKRGLFCLNGKDRIMVQTLHGAFAFAKQRLVRLDGADSDYLEATKQETVS